MFQPVNDFIVIVAESEYLFQDYNKAESPNRSRFLDKTCLSDRKHQIICDGRW